jgi:hypothetical protein
MRQKVYNSNCALLALIDKNQKDLLSKPGIYKISFLKEEHFYIGSTTESIKRRFLRHYRDLKNKKHCNKILQKAFEKYNETIKLKVLENCPSQDCIIREQHWIDTLKPVYNICKIAGNTLGIKPSKNSLKATSKEIDMFNVKGDYLKSFESIKQASRELSISDSSISQAIRKKGLSNNLQFRYKGKFTKLPEYKKTTSKPILQYDLDGNFLNEFSSILEASLKLNIPVGNISKHLNNQTVKCYDFIFKNYEKDYPLKIKKYIKTHKFQKQIIVENLETGKIIKYSSLRSIDKKIANRSTIRLYTLKNLDEFIIKNKYKIQIKMHDINEIM